MVTLWLVLTLAMVAVGLGTYLSTETRLMRLRLARAQAQAWARAGVYLGLERLASDKEASDWLGERWAFAPQLVDQFGPWTIALPPEGDRGAAFSGRVSVTITDEDRRLNVNRLEDPNLWRVVEALGGGAELADLLADYLDADEQARPRGLETQDAPAWYHAKNAPIVVLEELQQIPGLTDEHRALLQQYASPFLQTISTINLNTADLSLLQAICMVAGAPTLAEQIVAYRWDPEDGVGPEGGNHFVQLRPEVQTSGAPLDPGLKDALARVMTGPWGAWLGVQSSTFRIAVTTEITAPQTRVHLVAVVRRAAQTASLQTGGVSFHILFWQEA